MVTLRKENSSKTAHALAARCNINSLKLDKQKFFSRKLASLSMLATNQTHCRIWIEGRAAWAGAAPMSKLPGGPFRKLPAGRRSDAKCWLAETQNIPQECATSIKNFGERRGRLTEPAKRCSEPTGSPRLHGVTGFPSWLAARLLGPAVREALQQ